MNGISNPMNGTDEESNGIPALLLSEEDNVVTLLSLAERGDEVRIL